MYSQYISIENEVAGAMRAHQSSWRYHHRNMRINRIEGQAEPTRTPARAASFGVPDGNKRDAALASPF